jgi:hypothetical protein
MKPGFTKGFSEAERLLEKPFRFATLLEQLKLMRRKL